MATPQSLLRLLLAVVRLPGRGCAGWHSRDHGSSGEPHDHQYGGQPARRWPDRNRRCSAGYYPKPPVVTSRDRLPASSCRPELVVTQAKPIPPAAPARPPPAARDFAMASFDRRQLAEIYFPEIWMRALRRDYRYSVLRARPTEATATSPIPTLRSPIEHARRGILEENTAGGYYTYRFATDVVRAVLKDAGCRT